MDDMAGRIITAPNHEPALMLGPSDQPGLVRVLPLAALDRMEVWAPRIDGTLRRVNYGELARALVGLWSFLGGHPITCSTVDDFH